MNDTPISPVRDIVNDFHLKTLLRSAISTITGEIAQFSPAEIEKRITLKAAALPPHTTAGSNRETPAPESLLRGEHADNQKADEVRPNTQFF
jgi:hypothetical protein